MGGGAQAAGRDWVEAQQEVLRFLEGMPHPVVICTNSPERDWPAFFQLATVGRSWPDNLIPRPLIAMLPESRNGSVSVFTPDPGL